MKVEKILHISRVPADSQTRPSLSVVNVLICWLISCFKQFKQGMLIQGMF